MKVTQFNRLNLTVRQLTVLVLHSYDRTLDACSLRADLNILPFGDQTEVRAVLSEAL